MTKYIIIGAGGFGRELYHAVNFWLHSQEKNNSDDQVIGFLDDNLFALSGYSGYPPILCDIDEYQPNENELLFFALGIPAIKRFVSQRLEKKDAKFATLIHPDANIGVIKNIGKGCNIGWHAGVSCDVEIGNFVSLNANLTVGHDAVVEDYVEVGPGCAISGHCYIEEGVHIASNCTIAPGVRVGAWSKICANTAVMRDVPPFSYVTGVPGDIHRNFFQHPDKQ